MPRLTTTSIRNTSILIFSVILFISFSTNPPNGKTGAPGNGICAECHNPPSSSIEGFQTIKGLPEIVNPGEIYNLTISNSYTNGDVVRSGFQMVVLDEGFANAGIFSNADSGTAISSEFGRLYFEHAPAKFFGLDSTVSWTVDWQAPDGPLGDSITFYSSGILGNGSQSNGDRLILDRVKALLDLPSSTSENLLASDKINIYPNPANHYANIQYSALEQISNVKIYNMKGDVVLRQTPYLDHTTVDTKDLINGMYIVQLESSFGIFVEKLLIQH